MAQELQSSSFAPMESFKPGQFRLRNGFGLSSLLEPSCSSATTYRFLVLAEVLSRLQVTVTKVLMAESKQARPEGSALCWGYLSSSQPAKFSQSEYPARGSASLGQHAVQPGCERPEHSQLHDRDLM